MLRLTQKMAFKLMTAMTENRGKLESLSLAEGATALQALTGITIAPQSYQRFRSDLGWAKLSGTKSDNSLVARLTALEQRVESLEKELGK